MICAVEVDKIRWTEKTVDFFEKKGECRGWLTIWPFFKGNKLYLRKMTKLKPEKIHLRLLPLLGCMTSFKNAPLHNFKYPVNKFA